LARVQSAPVKLNSDNVIGTLHFLPAVRDTDMNGLLNVWWYDRRRNPNSGDTEVHAALCCRSDDHEHTRFQRPGNQRAIGLADRWIDYSELRRLPDNFIDLSGSRQGMFVAWSEGRFNLPQPFAAHQGVNSFERVQRFLGQAPGNIRVACPLFYPTLSLMAPNSSSGAQWRFQLSSHHFRMRSPPKDTSP